MTVHDIRHSPDGGGTVRLADMVTQAEVKKRWPWLSSQKLTSYRKRGRVRYFAGKSGEFVYPLLDLERAVTADLEAAEPEAAPPEGEDPCPEQIPPLSTEDSGSIATPGAPIGTDAGTTSGDDALESRALERVISKRPRIS